MNRIKALVLTFVVVAAVPAYLTTRSGSGASAHDPSSCCESRCCVVGAACCPANAGQE
jgi:hypothetical protein